MYLWIKAFHIISVITWMAGIFYLPRLFVYHVTTKDNISNERFKIMEEKLYRLIMTPSMIVAVGLGVWMLTIAWSGLQSSPWLWIKIALVALLVIFHLSCGQMIKAFAEDQQLRTERFFRIYNELPVLVLVPVVILAVVKPF
jgi:putative membrane protein